MEYKKRRWVILFFTIGAVSLLVGCVQPPKYFTEEDRVSFGTIGVVSAQYPPALKLSMPAKGGEQGAARGAGQAAAAALQGREVGIILFPVIVVGGAVYGAMAAEPAEKVANSEAAVRKVITLAHISKGTHDNILGYAAEKTDYVLIDMGMSGPAKPEELPNYVGRSAQGVDVVLEIRVDEFGTLGGGVDEPLRIFIRVNTRILKPSTGEVLASKPFLRLSAVHTLEEWSAEEGKLFSETLNAIIKRIAQDIVETHFLIVYKPYIQRQIARKASESEITDYSEVKRRREYHWNHEKIYQKTSPKPIRPISNDSFWSFDSSQPNQGKVNSLSPEFCWTAIQPEKIGSNELEVEVSNITYEFVLEGADGRIIYERSGLTEACHKIEKQLESGSEYYWKVRTWFHLDGQLRTTEFWGIANFTTPQSLSK